MSSFAKFSTLLLTGIFASCAEPNIHVVDQSGKPVPDATLIPMTTSMNGKPVQTGANGKAYVAPDFPTIRYLGVMKEGYRPSQVSYQQPKPIEIVLQR